MKELVLSLGCKFICSHTASEIDGYLLRRCEQSVPRQCANSVANEDCVGRLWLAAESGGGEEGGEEVGGRLPSHCSQSTLAKRTRVWLKIARKSIAHFHGSGAPRLSANLLCALCPTSHT